MAFDNHYTNRKDWRRGYHGAKSFDRSCRPGGSCPWCASNRRFQDNRNRMIAREKIEEHLNNRFP